jgi:hypothetical protein
LSTYIAHSSGLVEAGLELVGHQQQLVVAALERGADVLAAQLGVQLLAVFGEGSGPLSGSMTSPEKATSVFDLVAVVGDVLARGLLPAHRFLAAAGHHHGLGLATQQAGHVLAEVLDHHLHPLRDVVLVQPHPTHDALHGLGLVDLLGLDPYPCAPARTPPCRGVGLQHIQDEAFSSMAWRIE